MNTSMNAKILTLIIFLGCSFTSQAGGDDNPDYAVFKIPEQLLRESHTVIREDKTEYEIYDTKNLVLKRKIVRTILNEKGDDNNSIVVYYDNETSIKNLDGKLYDKFGNYVRKLKNSDIKDYSAVADFTIYGDSRVQYAELYYSEYPYTVEFEYEVKLEKTFYFPDWQPISSHSVSLENSSLNFTVPTSYNLRYSEINIKDHVVLSENETFKNYKWEINNIPGFEPEYGMPYYDNFLPTVLLAPTDFHIDGYSGKMTDWNSLGEFQNELNKDRDYLPESFIQKLFSLTQEAKSDREKIKIIYKFLQENTRYVSVQLGIGGHQPFEAKDVLENGYGDCKALSNFTYAMLKALGIKSHYTLINANYGGRDVKPDFPMRRFNHVILCVPNKGDTVWLECTSQTVPFGYLGYSTMNKHALIVTEDGGVLRKTPSYPKEQNLQIRNATVALFEDGSAKSEVTTKYTGLQYDNISQALDIGEEEQKKYLYKHIDIPSFSLSAFSFAQQKEAIPQADETLSLEMKRFATVSGNRIFFQPNLMNKKSKMDKPVKERKFDLELLTGFQDIDTIVYNVPLDYHLEFIPEEIKLESEFGSYYAKVVQEEGQIIYIRHRSGNKGVFPKEKYEDFVKFSNEMAEADKLRIVLVKET